MMAVMKGIPSSDGLSSTIGKVLGQGKAFLEYLQLPSRSEYWQALQQAGSDVVVAMKSVNNLSYLTFRPLLLLVWLFSQKLYIVAKFLFRHLFQGLYVSTIKGLEQLHWLVKRGIAWQYSLTPAQLKLEAGAIALLVSLYLLRRHIEQQGYIERVKRWYRIKERRAVKFYRLQLDRISKTSILLAMILPHALFGGVCIAVKLLFPRLVTYLARDTYLIFGLSVLYPWIWTVSLLFHYRHPEAKADADKERDKDGLQKKKDNNNSTPTQAKSHSYSNATANSTSKRGPLKEQAPRATKASSLNKPAERFTRSQISSMYPRTAPKTPTGDESTGTRSPAKTRVQRFIEANKARNGGTYSMQEDITYWSEYWFVYSLFTAACRVIYLVPIVGRILSKSTWLAALSVELQLGFYLWIYCLGSVLTSTASSDADLERSYLVRPLPFMVKRLSPWIQRLYKSVSQDMVSQSSWVSLVEKGKPFLGLAVMMRILSEDFKNSIVHSLEKFHPFLVPAVTLLMPGFVTEYGVIYVRAVVPANKAVVNLSLSDTAASLQYWILQALVAGTLQWLSGLLWWIPFSTHFIFLLWCRLQYSSNSWYNIMEQDLQAFGLLPKTDSALSVDQTVTASLFRRLASSLPSAASSDENVENVANDNELQVDAVESEKKDKDSKKADPVDDSAPAIDTDEIDSKLVNPVDDTENVKDYDDSLVVQKAPTTPGDDDSKLDENESTSKSMPPLRRSKRNARATVITSQ